MFFKILISNFAPILVLKNDPLRIKRNNGNDIIGRIKIYNKLYYNETAGGDIISWPHYLKLKLWILRNKELKSALM